MLLLQMMVWFLEDFASHQEKDGLQPLRRTGDVVRSFADNGQYGHLHDRASQRMIDAGLCAQMGQRLGSQGNLLGLSNGTAKKERSCSGS